MYEVNYGVTWNKSLFLFPPTQAGQAAEPECMISSCLIAGRDGQVGQLGHHHQAQFFLFIHYENTPIQRLFSALKIEIENLAIYNINAQNIDCGYTLEPSRQGGYNEYPQSMFCIKNKKTCIPLYTPVLLYISGV